MSNFIFVTGAPGSKWSSVVKNIYYSKDLDQSDYSRDRLYYHDADTPGTKQLMHLGAYWDPGMEFGSKWHRFDEFSKDEIEREFNLPFSGKGKRIIKSHIFSHYLNRLSSNWRDTPIVLVHRNNFECYKWWVKCGEFNITYPLYDEYYLNLSNMWRNIVSQNKDIMEFVYLNRDLVQKVETNVELCTALGIRTPNDYLLHNYREKDLNVYVYK